MCVCMCMCVCVVAVLIIQPPLQPTTSGVSLSLGRSPFLGMVTHHPFHSLPFTSLIHFLECNYYTIWFPDGWLGPYTYSIALFIQNVWHSLRPRKARGLG